MIKQMYLIIWGILSSLFFFNLFDFPMNITKQYKLNITEKDNNKQFKILSGHIIQLKLKASLGTGYAWRVTKNNPKILKLIKEDVLEKNKSGSEENRLGAQEFQLFYFKGQMSGNNLLEMHYDRRWEKKSKPAKIFSITVVVVKNL